MIIKFSPAFRRFVKKQSFPFQLAIQDEVDKITSNPVVGEEKKSDLAGFQVHKFIFHRQEYLIAFETQKEELVFVMIGTHQNFYRDLKKYQKEFRQ
ncbi:MAG: type II toxin-antitoxin system RelE/ParE family toxin [Thermodesulfobacteriota bacterium]